jgi:hypothetical protein
LLYVVAGEVGAPTAQALLKLVAAVLEKEGLPAGLRAVLGVVPVDSLPKGSTVELQLYAEENAEDQAPTTYDSDDGADAAVAEVDVAGMFCSRGVRFSRVLQEPLEGGSMDGVIALQVAGRAGKHCVVHVSVQVRSPSSLQHVTSREFIGKMLTRLFAVAFEALQRSGLSPESDCVCVRLLRHVDCAPLEGELMEAAAGAAGGDAAASRGLTLPAAVVEVGTLHRGEPIALHIVAASSS